MSLCWKRLFQYTLYSDARIKTWFFPTTHPFVFKYQGLAHDPHIGNIATMIAKEWRHFPWLSVFFFWIFQYSFSGRETNGLFSGVQNREEVDNMAPLSHFTHWIHSQVIIMTCLDTQSGQLSQDALPHPVLLGSTRQKESISSDRMLSPSTAHCCTPEWMCKMPSMGGRFPAERVHLLEANPKSLHLKSMLPKIMAFLSSLSFHKNNVQMSLVEINKTQEFLISLE